MGNLFPFQELYHIPLPLNSEFEEGDVFLTYKRNKKTFIGTASSFKQYVCADNFFLS